MILATEGRQESDWDHTAALLATLVNVNRGPKDRPVSPAEMHPTRRRQQRKPDITVSIKDLKGLFGFRKR